MSGSPRIFNAILASHIYVVESLLRVFLIPAYYIYGSSRWAYRVNALLRKTREGPGFEIRGRTYSAKIGGAIHIGAGFMASHSKGPPVQLSIRSNRWQIQSCPNWYVLTYSRYLVQHTSARGRNNGAFLIRQPGEIWVWYASLATTGLTPWQWTLQG